MREHRENIKMCGQHQKNSYRSTKAAQRVADRVMEERGTVLRWYYDSACGSVHLTSQAAAEAAA